MVDILRNWFQRYFANAEVGIFWLFLIFILAAFFFFSSMLAPVLVSIVVAYLLQWFVAGLERYRVPHALAVVLVYAGFIGLVIIGLVGLLPLLWRQLSNLFNELPNTVGRGQAFLMALPKRYPDYISGVQLQQLLAAAHSEFARLGQVILSASVASIPSIIAVVVYLVLVPLLVYFFLMAIIIATGCRSTASENNNGTNKFASRAIISA